MTNRIVSFVVLGAFAFTTGAAIAEPVKLSKAELDKVVAGAIQQVNGGGKTPSGNANGIPSTNPAGNAPPGQNK
jgi:hypothetical protein